MFFDSPPPLITRHKPGLENVLKAVGLDVVYHRAQGDVLYFRDERGMEIEVLDFVGGYGVMLLGHANPAIVDAVTSFVTSGTPNHVQGSIRTSALRLAETLEQRVGCRFPTKYCTVFANSGTEAVEAALKHAMLETQSKTFIAVEGGFHGKTLGALHVTSNPRFRKPFEDGPERVVRVAANDVQQLQAAFARVRDLAGFIYEPIQGEAGVRPLNPEFVQAAEVLCRQRSVPMIADECQTGLGRTGSLLASHALGVCPDYVILSKSLGGGIAKISALMIRAERYRGEFDLLHSSTFSDDELSCHVALRVLDELDDHKINACQSLGRHLLDQLRSLQHRFPSVIEDVRGAGMMIGVELRKPDTQAGFLLNHLADRNLLGLMIASFLFNEHRIRVAPTLSDSRTLRIQPSLLIRREQLQRLVSAIEDVCIKLSTDDVVGLTRSWTNKPGSVDAVPTESQENPPIYHYHRDQSRSSIQQFGKAHNDRVPDRRVAWVFHFIDASDLAHMDPAFASLTRAEKSNVCERWSAFCEPVVMDTIDIQSSTDEDVRLYPILLPVTSKWMLRRSSGKHRSRPQRLVQRAVDVAAELGCNVVSLGQFTSIVTRRGKSLNRHSMQITAGSNYSAALVNQAVRAALDQRLWNPAELTLGIVGAAGDIAGTCAAMMAPQFGHSILVGSGRADSLDRLKKVSQRIPNTEVSTSLRAIDKADVVICATNSTSAPILPDCLSPQAIVCDASVPATLHSSIATARPDVTVLPGAIVELPNREQLSIPGFPLPTGLTYGCMAEGLLLGLNCEATTQWHGRSSIPRAIEISRLAERYGFRAAAHSFQPPESESLR